MLYIADKKLREVKQQFQGYFESASTLVTGRFIETYLREFSDLQNFNIDIDLKNFGIRNFRLVEPLSCVKYRYQLTINPSPNLTHRNFICVRPIPYFGIFTFEDFFLQAPSLLTDFNPGGIFLEANAEGEIEQTNRILNVPAYFIIKAWKNIETNERILKINNMIEKLAELFFPYSIYLNRVKEITIEEGIKEKIGEIYLYKFNLKIVNNYN